MRWKETIWITIASVVVIRAQFHAIENNVSLTEISTVSLPATTPGEQIIKDEDNDNNNGTAVEVIDTVNSNETDVDNGINETNSNEDISNNSSPDENTSESESNSTSSNENGGEMSSEDGNTIDNENNTIPEAPVSQSIENVEENEVIVLTEFGEVKGRPYGTSGILSFFDIPYGTFAGPFEPPTKPSPWATAHDVKEHTKRCPQLDYPNTYAGDIDCLTLTIFTPLEAQNTSVLFHIHDGNFISGSGDPSIYGPDYLVNKGIILVLPNYRLGPLGFLCLQNETAPGNAALKDLALALEWTKNNIGAFGGNASEITVSGDGTSGALVGYLALSPASRDNFKRAITESGSVLSHWAIDREPITTATSLAEILRKNVTTITQRANIFQDVDIEELVIAADNHRFKPCIELGNNTFIRETPWDILNGNKADISFMIGSANHAGMHEAMDHTEESISEMNKNVELFLPDDLEFDSDNLIAAMGMKVKKQYFEEANVSLADLEKLSLYYTDASYLGPAIRGARPLAKAGFKVFFYEFAFVGELNRERDTMIAGVQGAARGDIVGYVFTQDKEMPGPETPEAHMVDTMTNLWTSFIKTGKPSAGNIEWNELKETSDSEEEWLSIELNPLLRRGLHVNRLRLWTDIYQQHFVDNHAINLAPSFYNLYLAIALLIGLRY